MKIKPSGIPACSLSKPLRRYEMNEFICLMQDGDDEEARWYFTCDAEDAEHAEEQALDGYEAYVIAVYRRVK
jgi:hypothetical protein